LFTMSKSEVHLRWSGGHHGTAGEGGDKCHRG
jgi:hypothetical protein